MFREKLTSNPNERGYLYIRESYYKRDRRTLKRKPSKLCDGSATKQRGKYSKKKDIYCGRIQEVDVKKLEDFKTYIKKQDKDYLQFKVNCTFDELLDSFVEYIIHIYGISKEDFFGKRKKVYTIGDGYLCVEIINWIKRFQISGDSDNPTEMQRFFYRCEDSGIYDEDIINSLYLKLVPDVKREEIMQEIENMQDQEDNKSNYSDLMDFLKKSR